MVKTASLTTELVTSAAVIEEMAATVLLIGEWLLKQQQQLAQQQRLLEENQRQIEAQHKQIDSTELSQLLGEDFAGILCSDCFSAYNPQSAKLKQKCLAHLERDLEALLSSRFTGNP